ncbi:hypothetical protein L226DRAFT_607413 [Lentinus tigrinus ALCF2SS1-7]|uniref:DRBM domain-containing protein n=1 Tax=Lentinus tigrinus ALCF2SS1-6 TaxID=1328759 RepID=A0A5C2S0Z9_9APHY|nr:hypothetical protein L227DRAFT_655784 [Lentinus tigrinus ALCF2SS1-6]RPD82255.1 hypothetical protein L226DRAFT_607413 [Lentinus tigrinus ALCF2SS1-7]
MIVGLQSFMDRRPETNHEFREPSSVWGYLPQLNQWAGTKLVWEVDRAGGEPHLPTWTAIPIYEGERLEVFKASGTSKKAAKEAAAKLMALSGHC